MTSNTATTSNKEEEDEQIGKSTIFKSIIYLLIAFIIIVVLVGILHLCGKVYSSSAKLINETIIEPMHNHSSAIKKDKFWPLVISLTILLIFIIIKSGVASS